MYRRDFLKMAGGALGAGVLMNAGASAPAAAAPMDAAAFHAARRYAQTRFGRIAYVERGSGAAALFLHGFPLNSFQWRGALDRLAPYRRCIAPDFMALGYTEVAEGQSVSPDAQVEMLVALLDQLGVTSADVVANDSGGAVAQLLVARHPGRVRSLLLTNCDAETDCPPPALKPVIELSRGGAFGDQWLAPWVADKVLARSPEGIGGMCFADPTQPTDEAIDCYLGPLVSSARRKQLVHAYALALAPNVLQGVAAALKRSRMPVRILWGTADTIFSPASPDYLDRAFGNSHGVLRLAGSKLFWPEERPDVIAAEALRLWGLA